MCIEETSCQKAPPWTLRQVTVLTTYLTPWSRIIPQKLIDPVLVKKFPAFYETRRFITTFTSVPYLSLSQTSSIQYTPNSRASPVKEPRLPVPLTELPQEEMFCFQSPPTMSQKLCFFLKIHFNIILPSAPSSSKWPSILQVSQPKPCMHLSCPPFVPHVQPISFFFI